MNFKLNNLKLFSKSKFNSLTSSLAKDFVEDAKYLDDYMQNLIKKLENSTSAAEADNILLKAAKKPKEMEMLEYTIFKHKDYNIISCLNHFGEPFVKNLKTLEKLDLNCVPELVTTINKDNSLYIITKHKGTLNGNLKPYFVDGTERVPTEAKLKAYKDLQKLTKAGLVDEQNLRASNWFYTPENEIFLPNWNNLRQLHSDESPKDIIEQYYNIIFGK